MRVSRDARRDAARSPASRRAATRSPIERRRRSRSGGVDDLERYVDRDALLRGDDPPDPPYWAHCWSWRARARRPRAVARRAACVEIGCGLGLPASSPRGAARARVFVDRVARAARVRPRERCARTDSTPSSSSPTSLAAPWRGPLRPRPRSPRSSTTAPRFAPLAARSPPRSHPSGRVLLADGHRIDTTRLLRREPHRRSRPAPAEDVPVRRRASLAITAVTCATERRRPARSAIAAAPTGCTSRSSGRGAGDRCRGGRAASFLLPPLSRERGGDERALRLRRASAASRRGARPGCRVAPAGDGRAAARPAVMTSDGGEREGALDRVLQLAHVARPVVARDARRARRAAMRFGATRYCSE
mgnify:CR=1 FL=1